jgi:hypothetical protein
MRLFPVLPLCTALVAAVPVGAEITAAELYAALNGLAAQADGTLSARPQASPGRLVLGDLTFTHRDGTRVILGPLTLIETPDQAVIATLPERFDLTVLPAHSLSPGVAKQVVFKVAMPGFEARIAGLDPDNAGITVKAASVSVTLDRVEPALPTGQSLAFALAAADLALSWETGQDADLDRLKAAADLGTIHADLSYLLLDPRAGRSKGEAVFDLAGLTARVDAALPPQEAMRDRPEGRDAADILQVLGLGARLSLSAGTGPFALTGTVEEPASAGGSGPIRFEAATEDMGASLAFDAASIELHDHLGKGRFRIQGRLPDQPIDDIGLLWDGYRSSLSLGLGTLVDPQPWRLEIELLGLGLSDQLWSLADPKSALPHDPATAIVKLSGSFAADPRALEPGGWHRGEDMPMAALSLALDKVLLAALGVEITATGAVDLDFSKVKAPEDVPEPLGRLSLVTKGANALIERLSTSGLLGPEELQSLRFGLLFIGRAGAAPDTLETTMEFGAGGAFSLNGQRIK